LEFLQGNHVIDKNIYWVITSPYKHYLLLLAGKAVTPFSKPSCSENPGSNQRRTSKISMWNK